MTANCDEIRNLRKEFQYFLKVLQLSPAEQKIALLGAPVIPKFEGDICP